MVINPLHSNIKIHTLRTVLFTFSMVMKKISDHFQYSHDHYSQFKRDTEMRN